MTAKNLLTFLIITVIAINFTFEILTRKFVHFEKSLKNRTEIIFRVDDRFTKNEQKLIQDTLTEIRQASGCIKVKASFEHIGLLEFFSWRFDGRPTIYRATDPLSLAYHIARHIVGIEPCLGVTRLWTGDSFIMSTEISDGVDDFRNVIEHEVLHTVFNSPWHSSNEESLMFPYVSGKQILTLEDILKLRKICGFKLDK